jgi:urease accessory protein
MLKAIAVMRACDVDAGTGPPLARACLAHDERHLRRRMVGLADGRKLLVDLPETVVLEAGDALLLEGGGHVEIAALDEPLLAVHGRSALHLAQLAWHIGNRHLPAAIEAERILILRDHVIRTMLEGLGARVEDIVAPFSPLRGAYSGGHAHHARPHDDHEHD